MKTLPIVRKKLADLSPLLNETLEAYYWMGFIMADGHLSKQNRLTVTLAIKDSDHLLKLKEFVNHKGKLTLGFPKTNGTEHPNISLKSMDTITIQKIKLKFNYKERKTYNLPDLDFYENLSDDLFLAFFIGFFDGDGYTVIRKSANSQQDLVPGLVVKIHANWLPFLVLVNKRISKLIDYNLPGPKINNAGYAVWMTSNSKVAFFLKEFIDKNSLYVLPRKWSFKIRLSKYDESARKMLLIQEQIELGNFSYSEISKILNLNWAGVYYAMYNHPSPLITRIIE